MRARNANQLWLLNAASKECSGSFHSSERMKPTASLAPCNLSIPASSHSTEIGPVYPM